MSGSIMKCILISWSRHDVDYYTRCRFRILDTDNYFETYLPYYQVRLYENKEIELKGFDLVQNNFSDCDKITMELYN